MSKTAIWEALGKTNPAHTKQFSRPGGFKGTSLKPMWAYKMLTEQFGPVGVGWGHNKPDFQVVHAGTEGEALVFCTVECWHTDRANTFHGVGGDKVLVSRKSGMFADDEAFKKAFTDAVMNAFKSLGVGADIHMGQFDDDKYVAAMEAEFAPKPDTINHDQVTSLELLLDSTNFPAAEFLKVSKLDDLRQLPANRFDGAMRWITEQAKQKENA